MREVIPAAPGPLALHYPRWIPGRHRPVGQIANVTEFRVRAGETAIEWKRDDADPFSFRITVPRGVASIEVTFDLLLAAGAEGGAQFMTVASPKVMTMNWNDVLVYPKMAQPLALTIDPSVKLPNQWKYGTALPLREEKDGRVFFKDTTLETLIETHRCSRANTCASSPSARTRKSKLTASCSRATARTDSKSRKPLSRRGTSCRAKPQGRLFGGLAADPYRDYTFLLGLSNHHPRSRHRTPPVERQPLAGTGRLVKAAERRAAATLFPHEFGHAWNGKFRRPTDMIVPDYQNPQKTRLLWVYEGLTNYIGWLLATRKLAD